MSSVEERVKKIVAEQLGVKEEEVTNQASQKKSPVFNLLSTTSTLTYSQVTRIEGCRLSSRMLSGIFIY
jgi:adenylosuccinate lyase